MRLLTLAVAAALCACATGAVDPMSDLAGVYTRHFTNGTVDGDRYLSEDWLEISRVDTTHASVTVALEFFNGHSCELAGDATLEGETLIVRPSPENDGLAACALRIEHAGDAMLFHDPDGGCTMHFCGARGGFEGVRLPYSSRRRR